MVDAQFFTVREYGTFGAMVRAMRTDAHSVAERIILFGAPREAMTAMADKYAADHALAYGEHTAEQCDEWCSFPTGNEPTDSAPTRVRVAARHTLYFDETGGLADGSTYLTFGCSRVFCPYRDFVVANDYESAKAAAIAAFRAVDAH